jgi:hypothetical protein
MSCEAWQYNSALTVARVFHMEIKAGGLVPMLGRDSYLCGRGLMHGKLAGLFTVAHGSGPECDMSELVTFLNDAVIFAPSMLLRLRVSWSPVGERSFDISLTDRGHRVTARVLLDDRDLPCDFTTDDRYRDTDQGPVRTRWSTPVGGWYAAGGRSQPSVGWASWDLPDGAFTYAEFTFGPGAIRYNIAPADGQAGHRARQEAVGQAGQGARQEAVGQTGQGARQVAVGLASTRQRLSRAARNLRNWGATSAEQEMTMPGDELVAEPAEVVTRAVTINAPAQDAWRWLVQIGQNRGGMYSYDWLENLFGLRIHSAREIRQEWQQLVIGDEICLVRPGWLGLKKGFALPVARIDPGRSIILREQPPAQPWNAVWSFHLIPNGAAGCRLLSRSRQARPSGATRLAGYVMDPVALLMTRKMLLGIKERAETAESLAVRGRAVSATAGRGALVDRVPERVLASAGDIDRSHEDMRDGIKRAGWPGGRGGPQRARARGDR